MAMKCAQCGTRLVPGTRSCANCGQQFATEVPPDPTPVQAAAAPPQAPYGQAPQAPYAQAPVIGQGGPMGGPTPGPAGPQDPVKKYGPWAAVAVVALLAYNHFSHPDTPQPQPNPPVTQPVTQPTGPTQPQGGPTQPTDPSQPTQPTVPVQPVSQPTGPTQGGDANPLVANINQLGQLHDDFIKINSQAQPSDPNWRAAMEQNAQQLKSVADQGLQMPWPPQLSQGAPMYQSALSEYSYVGGRWPAAVENNDQAGIQDCITHFKAADATMAQLFAYLKANTSSGGGTTGQGQMQSRLGPGLKIQSLSGTLNYHPKK